MTLKSRIILHDEGYDGTGFSNENSLIRAFGDEPAKLTTTLTHLFGAWGKGDRFPLVTFTEGQKGGIRPIPANSVQYQYPVVGKRKTTEVVQSSSYGPTSTPGINNTTFEVVFRGRWFPPYAQIRGLSGRLCRVMGEPVNVAGGGAKYLLQLVDPLPGTFLDPADLVPGSLWGIAGGSTVTQSLSTGNWSPIQTPGSRKNQISFIRKSFRMGGNVANRKVTFQLVSADGRQTNLWADYELYQHMLGWREEKELQLWLSEYSRDAYGKNPLIDPSNQLIIPTGAGLRQQIPNADTYATLTAKRIQTILGDVFRGATDTANMNVVLYCGDGFAEEFDTAMKNSTLFQLVANGYGDKFISAAENGGLALGGYFTKFKSVDGHTVTLKKLPFLNEGGYAETSGTHPVTGRPLSSYEAYFIDHSVYDGVPNVQLVYEEGRMEVRGIRRGMSVIPGSSYGDFMGMSGFLNLATEVDETSIHYMGSCGVQMLRDTHSFRLSVAV